MPEDTQDVTDSSTEAKEPETTEEVVVNEGKQETVPYERLQDVLEQNRILKRVLDTVQAPKQVQTKPKTDYLSKIQNPEDREAVEGYIKEKEEGMLNLLGGVADQLDEVKSTSLIPNYNNSKSGVKEQVEELRKEWAARGTWLNRLDAYGLLKSRGVIKEETIMTDTPKTKVDKQKVQVATEKGSLVNRTPSTKPFKDLTLEEKEKALEGKSF